MTAAGRGRGGAVAEDREALKARIRALLSRTTARGCTEAEALAAFAKAQHMMAQHGLTQDAVETGRATIGLGRARRSDVDRLWAAVAYACRCRSFRTVGGREITVTYVGRLPWPDVALWMHEVVAGAAARASREFGKSPEAKRRRTARTRNQAKQAFMAGFITGLYRNIAALVGEHDEQGKADLVFADEALKAEGPMQTASVRPLSTGGSRFSDALAAGHDVGRSTKVRWGVDGGQAPRAIGHDR